MMIYFLNYNHSVTIAKGPVPVITGTAATPPSMDEVNWGARATETHFLCLKISFGLLKVQVNPRGDYQTKSALQQLE